MTNRQSYVILGTALGLLVAFKIVQAYYVFPPPAGDGVFWLVAVVNYMNDVGFINQFTDWPTATTGIDGDHSVIGYSLLPWYLVSLLAPYPSIVGASVAIAIVESVTLVVFGFAMTLLAKRIQVDWSFSLLLFAVFALAVLASNAFGGRPEFATMLVAATCCLLASTEVKTSAITWGVLLGFSGSTTPIAGVLIGAIIFAYFSYRFESRLLLGKFLAAGFVSLLVYALILESRFGFGESGKFLLNSQFSHFRWVTLESFTFYNFLMPAKFMYGLIVFSALIAALSLPIAVRPKSLLGYYTGLAVLLVTYCAAAVVRPEPVYNIHGILPIFIFLLFFVFLRLKNRRGLLVWGGLGIVAIPSVAFLVQVLALFAYLTQGIVFDAAKVNYKAASLLIDSERVGISGSAWALTDVVSDYDRYYLWSSGRKNHADLNQSSWIFMQQMYSGNHALVPPSSLVDVNEGLNHVLVLDCFNHANLQFGWFSLSRNVPGYGFALYRPIESVASKVLGGDVAVCPRVP